MNKLKNPFIKISLKYDLNLLFQDLAEQKIPKSPLTLLEEICICGFLSNYTPTQISKGTNYNAKSLQVMLSKVLYHLISRLTGEDKIKYQEIAMLLEDYKHPELEVLKQSILSFLSQNKKSSNQFKVTHVISTIKKAQETQKELSDSDKLSVKKLVEEGQCLASKDPYGAIKIFLNALRIHSFQMAAIVNIIHCYDKLEQYHNSFAVCDLVLLMLKNDLELTLIDLSVKGKNEEKKKYYVQIYTYLGKIMFDLAKENKNCSYIEDCHYFFNQALYHSPYSAIASSNMVDMHIKAISYGFFSNIEAQNQWDIAEKAMESLLVVAANPKSDFKQYKNKIVNDATLYCAGLDDWWQDALKSLTLLT
jgi:hypothetical protein